MTRWLPAFAVGTAVAAALLVALASIGGSGQRTTAERAAALSAELRCPDCQGLAVADSPTASAVEIRRQIDELLAGGATDEEVRRHFVDRYGEWILLAPNAPAAWLLPFAVVMAGGLALLLWLRNGRDRPAVRVGTLDPDERRRLRDEVEAIDA
jgi:cytochrome c-type biogenesis protein CcmH